MKTVSDISFEGKRVLVRVDFNVPLSEELQITDDTRIKATIPTLKAIMANGGRPVVMSHLGRPKGVVNPKFSLKHVQQRLAQLMDCEVLLANDCIGSVVEQLSKELANNQMLLLENVRFYNEETDGDSEFAKKLALNGDYYVNDAFGTAHRAHASTAVIAQFFGDSKCFGKVMAAEIVNVEKVLKSKDRPVTAIVGGAKVSSKLAVLENLLDRLDHLVIAGGMAFTFIKAKGGKVGNSLVEDDYLATALDILQKAEEKGVTIHLPVDSLNAGSFSNEAQTMVSATNSIPDGWMGLDAGPKTIEELKPVLLESKTILWNGPMGVFEFSTFENGTKSVAEIIAQSTEKGCFSIVGGGDSVAAVKQFGMAERVSYVSTGGGAMLEYLEGKTLPGIEAILN